MKIFPFFPDDPADTGIFANVSDIWSLHISEEYLHRNIFHYTFGVNNFSNIYLNMCQKKIGVISVFDPVIAI